MHDIKKRHHTSPDTQGGKPPQFYFASSQTDYLQRPNHLAVPEETLDSQIRQALLVRIMPENRPFPTLICVNLDFGDIPIYSH